MNPLIRKQLLDFFIMFYSGLAVMLFYQIYEAYQRRFHPRGFLLLLEELLFWLFASLLVTSFLYFCGYGAIHFHSLAALLCGACAWRFFLGEKISGILHYCSRVCYGIIGLPGSLYRLCGQRSRRDQRNHRSSGHYSAMKENRNKH